MDGVSATWRRGSVVLVASRGASSGEPRPALVVQADLWNATHASVAVCLITTTQVDAPLFRLPVLPSEGNGLRAPSQIMVDKLASVPASAIGETVGHVDGLTMRRVDEALRRWIGLP